MKLIPIDSIVVHPRQRTSVPDKHIDDLKRSILDVGLLHPPVCWFNDESQKWELVAGECRMKAIKQLRDEGKTFWHSNAEVVLGSIPINGVIDALTHPDQRFEAELDENLRREKLSWQDETHALAKLHEMRRKQNPLQTVRDTAREVSDLSGGAQTTNERKVREARLISSAIAQGNEKIANARNQAEAMALLYRQEEDRVKSIIARRALAKLSHSPIEVRQGDLAIILPSLDPDQFDLILADPPYGIRADSAGFRARTQIHHSYDDSLDAAQALAEVIITEGFRVSKRRANLLMFFDIRNWDFLNRCAKQMGWAVFPRPIIWRKSESEGMAPWGGQGPRLTTEMILYATKGQRGMTASPTDVFEFKRVSRTERSHAAEKPVELLKKLIEVTTLPGDSVLDPCCGSGSTLVAAREAKRIGLGIEKDPHYFNLAFANLHGAGAELSEVSAAGK